MLQIYCTTSGYRAIWLDGTQHHKPRFYYSPVSTQIYAMIRRYNSRHCPYLCNLNLATGFFFPLKSLQREFKSSALWFNIWLAKSHLALCPPVSQCKPGWHNFLGNQGKSQHPWQRRQRIQKMTSSLTQSGEQEDFLIVKALIVKQYLCTPSNTSNHSRLKSA